MLEYDSFDKSIRAISSKTNIDLFCSIFIEYLPNSFRNDFKVSKNNWLDRTSFKNIKQGPFEKHISKKCINQ